MGELKKVSMNAELLFADDSFIDEGYIKTRIKVMHDGLNPNNSNFEAEAIEKAKETLKNRFILANVVQDENGRFDFGAHDFEVEENKFAGEGYKVIYKELPIGLVPETNNYEFKQDSENNKWYVYVDALIVRDYSNYAEDIVKRYISENKSIKISMEIIIKEDEEVKKDSLTYLNVLDYRYDAITFLGEQYGTGMVGAKAEFNSDNNKKKKEEFIKKVEKLKELFTNEKKEGETMKDTSKTKENSEVKNKDYSLTANKIFNILEKAFPYEEEKDENGEIIRYTAYWVMDYDKKSVYVNKYNPEIDNYFKVDYVINEETQEVVVDWDTMKDINRIYVTKEEQKLIEENRDKEMNELKEENSTFSKEVSNLKELMKSKNEELETLQEFKLEVEKESERMAKEEHDFQIKEMLENFALELSVLDEDKEGKEGKQYQELKEKACDMELEELEQNLFALVGRVKYKKKVKSKTKPVKNNKSFVNITEEEEEETISTKEYDKYSKYGAMVQYIK